MKKNPRSHRHFLVVPFFLCLVVLSVFAGNGIRSPEASVIEEILVTNVSDRADIYRLTDDLQAQMSPGAEIAVRGDMLRGTEGTFLFSGEGQMSVRIGEIDLFALAGAFYVTARNETVSVAALTTPVLVVSGEQYALIPAGLQWRGDAELEELSAGFSQWLDARLLKEIPLRFKKEQLEILRTFPVPENAPLQAGRFGLMYENMLVSFASFELPFTRMEHHRRREDALLNLMPAQAQQGNADWLASVLADVNNDALFQSGRGRRALMKAFALLPEDDSVRQTDILMRLLEDERLWLLLSFHPDYRIRVWGMVRPELSTEATMAYLFTLPQSNILPEALPAYVLEEWGRDVSEHAAEFEDPKEFLEPLSGILAVLIGNFAQRDYPLRARELIDLLADLERAHPSAFTDDLRGMIKSLRADERVLLQDLGQDTQKDETAEEPLVHVEALSPDAVVQKAKEMLRRAQALFTVETAVDAKPPSVAQVRGIVFGTQKGDRSFNFDLDVRTGQVHGITENGETLPYSLSFGAFVRWVREG